MVKLLSFSPLRFEIVCKLDKLVKQSPWYNNTAGDLIPELRVNTQAILQKYTTHSISSTVNVEEDVTTDYIRTIYEHAWNSGLKGITVNFPVRNHKYAAL